MIVSAPSPVDIVDILARNAIEVHFQPIVSVRQRTIIGVEALSRGRDNTGTLVPPAPLFRGAAEQHLMLELDGRCRRAALDHFVPLYRADNKLVLFLNTHASTLVEDVQHPEAFAELVQSYGLDVRNIAVEILEADAVDTALLRAAAAVYHRHGFLVVLDDVGAGYSNLDRMLLVRPDIIKADRALVHDLHHDAYKQGVFKALVSLSERIGGWVVTEGVETREDAVVALDLGADMLQGFFFGRPHPVFNAKERSAALERVTETANHFRRYTLEHFTLRHVHEQHRRALVQHVAAQLAHTDVNSFAQQLRTCITMYPDIASACVLDAGGQQITETVLKPQPFDAQKTIIFEPPQKGTDHSL
jgi:EAL domain-containing protein (putative c-di-GMP-specific phosphodiesterase class I)